MAYEQKTKVEEQGIDEWLAGVAPPECQAEARRLIEVFREVTGWEPRLYTGNMVGFGRYAYTYDSGHSGTSMATGFSPRKAELSIYILPGYGDFGHLLARLGKHKMGKACLYLKRLSDADEGVLRELIAAGLQDLQKRWVVEAT